MLDPAFPGKSIEQKVFQDVQAVLVPVNYEIFYYQAINVGSNKTPYSIFGGTYYGLTFDIKGGVQ